MKRSHRRLTAWFALLAVCFVQMATAAHACARVEAELKAPAAGTATVSPCHEVDAADVSDGPALCLEHCNSGLQLVDHHSPVTVADSPAIVAIDTVHIWDNGVRSMLRDRLIAPATAPPVFASSSRLRI